jgi:hypothetical protein
MNRKKLSIAAVLSPLMVLFGLTSASCNTGNKGAGRTFSVQQLAQDYALFRKTLEEGQPGIYRYTPKEEMDRFFAEAQEHLNKPMDSLEFYRVLAPVFASLKDGHGELFPAPDVKSAVEKSAFPFDVRVIEGKVYILEDYTNQDNALAGKELMAVNGTPVKTLLDSMLQVQPGDANGEATRPYRIGHDNGFRQMLYPMFGIQSPYKIEYRAPGTGETREGQFEGLPESRLQSLAKGRYYPAGGAPSVFGRAATLNFMDGGQIAVLRIYGFGGMAGSIFTSLGKFIDNSFHKIHDKRTSVLIIDVRDNDGGVPELGEQLFSYLVNKPFPYYKDLILNARTFSFFPYADSSKPIPEDIVKLGADGKYHYTGHRNWGLQQPREPHFDGRVLVLMNGGSFSVTAEFLAMTKSLTHATLIGQESGGAFQGNNSGMKYDVILPNSRIVMRIPIVSHYVAVDENRQPMDRGVLPDISVHYTIGDLLNHTDLEMKMALELAHYPN